MTVLDRLRPADTDLPTTPATAAVIGLWSVAISWLAVALPTLLAWATAAQTTASWGQAMRVASDVWLACHRVGIHVPDGTVALAPLAASAVPVWLCWRAGRRVVATTAREAVVALAAFAGAYGAVLVLIAAVVGTDAARPVIWQAAAIGVLLPALAGAAGAARSHGSLVAPIQVPPWLAGAVVVWPRVRAAIRPALAGAAALCVSGALLVTVSLVLNFGRVLSVHQALNPGVAGSLVLILGQVALLPNMALWGVAYLAGPGFAVGAGTSVGPGGTQLGLLPLVPVLGGLPTPGPTPVIAWAVILVPVLVGCVLGWWVATHRRGSGVRNVVLDAALCAAVTAAVLAVLLAFSGGSAGPGAMSAVGPSAWKCGLVLAGELIAGACLVAWLTGRRRGAGEGR